MELSKGSLSDRWQMHDGKITRLCGLFLTCIFKSSSSTIFFINCLSLVLSDSLPTFSRYLLRKMPKVSVLERLKSNSKSDMQMWFWWTNKKSVQKVTWLNTTYFAQNKTDAHFHLIVACPCFYVSCVTHHCRVLLDTCRLKRFSCDVPVFIQESNTNHPFISS